MEDYGISLLDDAHYNGPNHISQQFSLFAEELDLEGEWRVLWNNYIGGLSHGCIRLSDRQNSLVWMYNKHLGQVTAQLAYEYIASSHYQDTPEKDLGYHMEI